MIVYRLYFGLKDRSGYAIDAGDAEDAIRRYMDRLGINAATFFSATGVWLGETEKTIVVEFADVGKRSLSELARLYASQFNQETVMIVRLLADVEFIP